MHAIVIDLHSHILPGIDDGSKSLEMSIEMARIAVEDGIEVMACTPHIYPGLYMNDTAGIKAAADALQRELYERGIPLKLTTGADVHLVPGLLDGLRAGTIPTLNDTRYLLLEPSHHVAPPRFADSVFNLVAAGYVPVITHPERLTWVEDHFQVFVDLVKQGAWMQVTAGALTGLFGPRAKYWGEKFIGDGLTHILATDAHSNGRRSPRLQDAKEIVQKMVGREEAQRMTTERPHKILMNVPPHDMGSPPESAAVEPTSWFKRLLPRR